MRALQVAFLTQYPQRATHTELIGALKALATATTCSIVHRQNTDSALLPKLWGA